MELQYFMPVSSSVNITEAARVVVHNDQVTELQGCFLATLRVSIFAWDSFR
jgi:hypothetical protein